MSGSERLLVARPGRPLPVALLAIERTDGERGTESPDRRLVTDGGQTTQDSLPDNVEQPLSRVTDGLLWLDESWTVTYINDAGREILGDVATDIVGRDLWDAVPEAAGSRFQDEFEVALDRQESCTFEEYSGPFDTWFEVRAYPSEDGLSVFFTDITERKRAERELQESEQALQRLHAVASDPSLESMAKIREILAIGTQRLDVDLGFLTDIEDSVQEVVEAVGDHSALQPGATAPLEQAYCRRTLDHEGPLAVSDAANEGWEGDPAYERFGLGCYLGSTIHVDGEQYGTVCFADTDPRDRVFTDAERTFADLLTDWVSYILEQDKYERERTSHQERLSGILETTQQLMQARSREEVAEIAATAARDVLGFEINLVRLYDADAGTLWPAGQTTAPDIEVGEWPVRDVGDGISGEVFATGESRVVDDLGAVETDVDTDLIRSGMYYPMGVHGTLSIGATQAAAFDETDEQVLALLATAAAAACMRAKREREVREAREHVETVLERVNGLIENTIEVLVEATTREELEDGVVAKLAAAEPHTFAWIGRPDVATDTISPTAAAGGAALQIEDCSFDLREGGPVARAHTEGTAQVVPDVTAESDPLASLVADTTVRSMTVVPLAYKDTEYGVMVVMSDDPDAFDEREQVVLNALGRAVANAINAIERGRILDANEVIELEFAIDDADLLLSRLSRQADCTLTSAGTDYRADGTFQMYLTSTDVDGEELTELARQDDAVVSAKCIVDHDDECLLEVVIEESLVGLVTEYGAVPQQVTADTGTVRFTVELPYEAEARELFDLVKEQYPSTDLVGYHEHERPVETRQEFRASLSDRFTDRQETALRTAFLGGFFEWPRQIDGNELAEAMDISRPTYHQHLRAAQQKVLEELFGSPQ